MTDPIVSIKQGKLKGTTDTDLNGETILKFCGIPFAKPPVGSLRFKAPQPPGSWSGTRDATKDGNPCLAIQFTNFQLGGSEDCLYLNVFTKALPNKSDGLKPVMVFFHGGGFIGGSCSQDVHGPKYLLTEDIVLVVCNYRLGIFGFLSIDDPSLDVPGNAGLKDQTFALKWVKENISSFNGDPNNVTIFGVSAGGASVHFQIFSPTAKGLFHKAICQSGVALNPWPWGQKNNAIQVVEKLDKKASTEKQALEILMQMDPVKLYEASLTLHDVLEDSSRKRPFSPVIEYPNPSAFLTESPLNLLKTGKFNQVPTIMGVCSNEGLLIEFFKNMGKKIDIDAYECGIMWMLGLKEGTQKRANVKKSIKDFYFKDGVNQNNLYKLIGDVGFLIGFIESTEMALKTSSSPIYTYLFDYDVPEAHIIKQIFEIETTVKGVSHAGDQSFLFNTTKDEALDHKQTQEDRKAIIEVVKIWTDFAKTGKPHEQWQPNENGNFKYFNIDKEVSMRQGHPFSERVAFWQNLLKELGGIDIN